MPGAAAGAAAPQMPALLFSLASCPMVGPLPVGVVFFKPALACDQSAPNASPDAAGFEAAGMPGFEAAIPMPDPEA